MNEFLPCLQSQASFLSETQHSASAPCQRAVCQSACGSQITLWWRITVVIVVCSLHPTPPPPNKYEDLWKTRAEHLHGRPRWQQDRRREAETQQGMMGTLVPWCSGTWGGWGQIMNGSRTIVLKGEDFIPRKRDMSDIINMERKWQTSHFFCISAIFCIILKCGFKVPNRPAGVVCLINQD